MKSIWLLLLGSFLWHRALGVEVLPSGTSITSPDSRWEVSVEGGDTGDVTLFISARGSSERMLLEQNSGHFGAEWSPDSKTLLIYDNLASGQSDTVVYRQTPKGWEHIYRTPDGFHIVWRLDEWLPTSVRLRSRRGGSAASTVPPTVLVALDAAKGGTSLKDAAPFPIGVGVADRIPERSEDWPLLTSQFAMVTPENCLKPVAVQPQEGRFDFAQADAFVDFAKSRELPVVGHCLVWAKDDRTPPWFFRDGANPAGRDLVLARMKAHITAVAGRYRGRLAMWDVVNEALDDGADFLRPSGWSKACGEDFIVEAFRAAREADPDALLIYNDYNNELPAKREKQVKLIKLLRERGAPVQAIGLQGHYEIDRVPFADLEATLAEMRTLGMKVVISELDIDVIPRARWWADNGKHRAELARLDPYRESCPPEILQRQAEQYAQLFRLLRKYQDVIARVSFWNLHDGQSWLNGFPWRRTNHPLLFDRARHPKPAFDAVLKALQE